MVYHDLTMTTYDYDPLFHKVTLVRDANSNETRYKYDYNNGDLLEVTNAKGETTTYTYFQDPQRAGLVQTIQNARGFITTYGYDDHRRLYRETQPTVDDFNYVTFHYYDSNGNPSSIEYSRLAFMDRVITWTVYTPTNRLERVTDAEDYFTITTYYSSGLVFEEQNANGIITRHEYDRRGLETTLTEGINSQGNSPDLRQTTYAYDAAGNLSSRTSGIGLGGADHRATTTFSYDAFNRLRAQTEAAETIWGRTTHYDYDAAGNLTLIIDPLGRQTYHEYDERNRRWRTTENSGTFEWRETTTEYDAVGNVVSVVTGVGVNPHPSETFYAYDKLNRVILRIDGFDTDEAAMTDYQYDAVGNLIEVMDPRGIRTVYAYDALNQTRVKKEGVVDGVETRRTEMQYDPVGNLIWQKTGIAAANAHESVTTFAYYRNNRLKSKTEAVGQLEQRTTSYIYDAAGNLKFATTGYATNPQSPTGYGRITATRYDHDTLNRLIRKYEGWSDENAYAHLTIWAYDAADNQTSVTTGLGQFAFPTETRITYDTLNHRLTMTEAYGSDVQRTTLYDYDDADRLVEVTDPRGTITKYGYDRLDHQITMIEAWNTFQERTTTRVFDAADNLLSETTGQATGWAILNIGYDHPRTTTYSYDALNLRTEMTEAANDPQLRRTTTYMYDANGNLTRQVSPRNITTAFEYDQLNRRKAIIEAQQASDGTQRRTDYKYDAADNLIEETKWQGLILFTAPLTNRYEYDRLNRLTKIVEAVNAPNTMRTTTKEYDAVDNLKRLTTGISEDRDYGLRKQTEFLYDDMHRVVFQTERAGLLLEKPRESWFGYDAAGNLRDQTTGFMPDNPELSQLD